MAFFDHARLYIALIKSPRRARTAIVATACATILLSGTSAQAVVFPSTSELAPYAIVSVGAAASLKINSGPITGKVLVGDGSSVATSGGGAGRITGGAYGDALTLLDQFSGLQTPPVKTLVSPTATSDAFGQAQSLQAFLNGLTATQTLGALSNISSITNAGAVAGLNVIDFASLHDATLTLSGNADDIFVLRTSGIVSTNRTMTLSGGLTADHVIWDLNGVSGNILQTSGGNKLHGTFLATMGGDFQFSALNLAGQLINTGGHIEFVSNSTMTANPFAAAPSGVPEPSSWALLLVGFGATGFALRKRKAIPRLQSQMS